MGSKRKSPPEDERPRLRLRLDEVARSGLMKVHDAQGVAAEQERLKSENERGLLKSISKKAKLAKKASKLKRSKKDDTSDEIRRLLESDEFGAPQSRIRFQPVEKPGDKKGHDIGSLWSEQERIRKDEERLEQSYKQAKEQAKKLKKQLLKNQIGDGVATDLAHKTSDLTARLGDMPLKLGSLLRHKKPPQPATVNPSKARIKLRTHTSSPDMPFASKTNPIFKSSGRIRRLATSKRTYVALAALIVVVGAVKLMSGSDSDNKTDEKGTLGAQVSSGSLPAETPQFELLYPQGKSEKDFKVVRVSPNTNAAAYAYVDTVESAQIKVTQQELPDRLKTDSAVELEKIAKDFQATSIIQVDDQKIYHGLNEKTQVQSLIFIKNERLVFIASPQKLSDDVWAAYYLSLQ